VILVRRLCILLAAPALARCSGRARALARSSRRRSPRARSSRAAASAADEPSLLPGADEQVVERARNLVRAGYADQGRQLLDDVAARHPDDLDVLLARAEFLMRQDPGLPVARFLDEQAKRPAVAKQLATRRAAPASGCATRPRRSSPRARTPRRREGARGVGEESRAGFVGARAARGVERGQVPTRSRRTSRDGRPKPRAADLAIEAARADASAGRVRAAIQRLRKFELANAAEGPVPDALAGEDGPPVVGSRLWELALALAARGEEGVDAADSVFVELALGDAYDPRCASRPSSRLFESARARPDESPAGSTDPRRG
jgi:hypothetical protein